MRTRRCARALEDCEAAKSRREWRLQLAPKGLNKLANGKKSLPLCALFSFCSGKWDFSPRKSSRSTRTRCWIRLKTREVSIFSSFQKAFRQSETGEQALQPQPPLPVFAKNLSDFRAQKLQGNDFCSGKWDFSPQKVVLPHRTRCWIRLKIREVSIFSSFQKAFRQSGAAENGGLPF